VIMKHYKDQRGCFAILNKLKRRFKSKNITEDAVWDYFKAEYGVGSRGDFSEKQWVVTYARLFAAERSVVMFDIFTGYVKEFLIKQTEQTDNSEQQRFLFNQNPPF